MSRDDDTWDDRQLTALFAASEDGPSPDEEFLRRLRETSAAEFTKSGTVVPSRRPTMFLFASRIAAAVAAATIAAAAWFFAGPVGASPTLGQALDKLTAADTLHLRIDLSGRSTEAWSKRPGELRWNLSDGTHQIVRGDRLWLVDEKANRATVKRADYFHGEKQGLDMLGFLLASDKTWQLDDEARATLLAAKPAGQQTHDGAACDRYVVSVPANAGALQIEALVDCQTGMLRTLTAQTGRAGQFTSLAAVEVLSVDGPVAEDLFVVGDSLTEDGRAGKANDAQGLCAVRPAMAERWTPLAKGMLVMPGDWLRTDLRGANALALRLVTQAQCTIGPGALVEVTDSRHLRLYAGDAKIVAPEPSPVEVSGPDGKSVTVTGAQLFRVAKGGLARLDQEPLWLKGFEGQVANESIGSLVATIDGRNTPLSVGYHKVTVDIRDQIARTVVEESFVNHTNARLEGVFYFPLPADASISGFGMWIGDELVEADVVEKQRAREIYETILRERRDPGLLEWTEGNIFKARVFPIEAHAEKRIKITYTQVLPLHGSSYDYGYALQSELLKQHPLRELSIDVKISSSAPLKNVASPTHAVRVQQAAHAARVEFVAQEYAPTCDFEVAVTLDGQPSPLALIPCRRGEDGYFMALLTPPAFEQASPRDLLGSSAPLDLLIVADTSASLDCAARQAQSEFIATLLGSLTPKDRVNLAGCDVDCDWVFEQSRPAEPKNIDALREFLERRVSLGWTDLDKAFASAFAKAGAQTRIIYVGDGIITAGDADPVAFGRRLRRAYGDLTKSSAGAAQAAPICYAVSVSSSFEAAALRAMAACGGGSVLQISGSQAPQIVARDLLNEITRPALKDLKVEFRDVPVARVYPADLPNLPSGSQQIILGRYLPSGADQTGEIVATGTFNGQPIRYAARVSFPEAEQGNSFIPRLWARRRLDDLLQQGASPAIQDEIIALSEEFNIITPYTSLLVLESDADRERFKVKRRFQMRDGERFFAQGRDNANFELMQQQMRRAGLWRQGLRRSVLAELSGLGRDAAVFQAIESRPYYDQQGGEFFARSISRGLLGRYQSTTGFVLGFEFSRSGSGFSSSAEPADWSGVVNGPVFPTFSTIDAAAAPESFERFPGRDRKAKAELGDDAWSDFAPASGGKDALWRQSMPFGNRESNGRFDRGLLNGDAYDVEDERSGPIAGEPPYFVDYDIDGRVGGYLALDLVTPVHSPAKPVWGDSLPARPASSPYYSGEPYSGDRLAGLFPYLPTPPTHVEVKEPEKPWPEEARAIAASLLREQPLRELKGGLRIQQQSDSFDASRAELISRSKVTAIISTAAWLTRNERSDSQTIVNWCNDQERGVIATAVQLGRRRASRPEDLELRAIGLGLEGFMLAPLEQSYRESDVELQPQGENRVLLRITPSSRPDEETRILIDTARHVVLSIEQRRDGQATFTRKYDDFVQVADAWWPGRIESFDAKGQRTSLVTQAYALLTPDAVAAEVQQQLAGRDRIQFLNEPRPSLLNAKRALAAGKARFEDQITLTDYYARTQRWTRVLEHLAAAEKLAADKPGMRWLRDTALNMCRRREELKTRVFEEAGQLAAPSGSAEVALSPAEELFLADRLNHQSAGILQANEMLRLLDALQPVYERQPDFTQAMKRWRQQQISCLRQTGQDEEARKRLAQLSADYPHDMNLLCQYARELAEVGEYDAALRLLREKSQWYEYCQILQSLDRWTELAQALAEWSQGDSEDSTPYAWRLSALVRLDQIDEANALAAKWLAEGQMPGKLAPAVAARLQTAVGFMLGQSRDIYMNRIDERWFAPLADAAIYFAPHETQGQIADRIMGDGRFTPSDACRRVRAHAVRMLLTEGGDAATELASYNPAVIQRLVTWAMANDPAVERPQWKKIAERLRKRWDAEANPSVKQQLAQPLVQILRAQLTSEELLGFLRVQWQQAAPNYRAAYARQLFDTLLAQPWSQANEDEALGLLEQLAEGSRNPTARLVVELNALHRFTDRMSDARYQAKMQAVEHPEKLTRTELQTRQEENRKAAWEGLADRLQQAMAQREGPLVVWLNAERLYLDIAMGRNLDKAVEDCWEVLGSTPKSLAPLGESQGDVERGAPMAADAHAVAEEEWRIALQEILRQRFLTMLVNLAARKTAPAGTAERLFEYLDAGIAAAPPDDLRWQTLKYQLLIALDRPRELEQALRDWAAADGPVNRWRISLGYLLAEQGKLPEAIALFEAVAAADELGPAEYRALADWYMAVDRRDDYQKSMIAVYGGVEDWRLENLLRQRLQPWQRSDGQTPAELDNEVLLVFATLFEKSPSPQNCLWQLQQFYRETHDFRLLACLADGVVGHTAERIYPFLQGMSGVLSEVRDEATADSIVEQLSKTRRRAKTDVDQRALDLLEVLVERRAAEVLNQPGPHVEKALAALQRAFKRPWTGGEPRLMADFLARLGTISPPQLAAEQLAELETLYRQATKDTIDRLYIATRLANAWTNYDKIDAAIDLLQIELSAYERAHGGVLPVDANDALDALISCYERRAHFALGERTLLDQLEHPQNAQQTRWLRLRLYRLYEGAIRGDGEVSLGRGPTLYKAVVAQIEADLATSPSGDCQSLVSRLCIIYGLVRDRRLSDGVVDDLRAFAFQRFPTVVNRQLDSYPSIVSELAGTVRTVAGPRDGVAFLVAEIEHEPRWLRYRNQNGWNQHQRNLSVWRKEADRAGGLGEVEPRLLKIVLAELRNDLESRERRGNVIYDRNSSDYWAEKESDFARVVEEVYAERNGSGAAVAYLAGYLFDGLRHYDRAIEMLSIAHRQGLLDESNQDQLIKYLQMRERFGETIALLLPLVERRPDAMRYRVWLMRAYFRTRQPAQLAAALQQADVHFHQEGRWTQENMAALAASCLESELFAESVQYYQELIPLYQRTQPNRGIGDETLSPYYIGLARAWAGRHNTAEAVEAACGAIVSWGPNRDRRAEAINALRDVLRRSGDLDAFVAAFDKRVAETGLDNPLVRKAVGEVYLERTSRDEKALDKAIVQLKIAVELQPNDTETYQALLSCYDKRGDREAAVAQLIASLEFSRRDIQLYEDLGRRCDALANAGQAERAYTSIVEMFAHEAEGHAALAKIRERQDRWEEAIEEWRHVARLRALEPTGLLQLAAAQIHLERWEDAQATVRQLQSCHWPSRFGDVEQQTWQLQRNIEQGRSAN